MGTTLPLYWNLSSPARKDRIDASTKLIAALEQFQSQLLPKVVSETSSDDSESEDNDTVSDGLDAQNAPDVSYAIRRLIRGLASPRESSRLGFAVALTELLARIDTVTCQQILVLIQNASQSSGSMTGQEERDMLFAKLFGITAIIQSGLLVRQNPLPSSSVVPSSLESFQSVLSHLLTLGSKKSWLRESSWWSLMLAVEAIRSSDVPWKEEAVEQMVNDIFSQDSVWSSEKLALALRLRRLYPQRSWHKPLAPFRSSDLLETSNLLAVGRILKDAGVDEDDDTKVATSGPANWKPELHFVWDEIFNTLLSTEDVRSSKGSFPEFFRIVVDETLFASSSSPQRKYWGFQVFQKALARLPPTDLPLLFTKNFMRSWINHMSNQDRYLHKIAKQVASDVHNTVTRNPSIGFSLVLQLTGTNGSRRFDRITKTKTVENILASMDAAGINNYINSLFSQVNEADETDPNHISSLDARRTWIVEQLAALLRHGSVAKEDEWVFSVLNWFTIHGFFNVIKKSSKSSYQALHHIPEPPFTNNQRELCRAKLFTALAELASQTSLIKEDQDSKKIRVTGVTSSGELWLSSVLNTITELQKNHKHVSCIVEHEKRHSDMLKKAIKMVHSLSKKAEEEEAARGVELLLAALVIKCYRSDSEDSEDIDILESCIQAASDLCITKRSPSKSRDEVSEDKDAATPIDILVDVIIGLLEKPSAFSRVVANQAFSMLSGMIQESTVALILTQLDRRNPEDDIDESAEEGSEDENEERSGSDSSEQSESDEEDESEDKDDVDEAENLELRRKLQEALNMKGNDANEDDSSEELLDDDQMMQIDEQLAEVFRARTMEKSLTKDTGAQREATYFKNRVLDLVDIFLKRQPSSRHILRLVSPLVDLVTGTSLDEQQLSDKASGIIRSRLAKSKTTLEGVEANDILDTLETLHKRARKARSSAIVSIISLCSVYLAKSSPVLVQDSLLRIYGDSLRDFALRKASALQPGFFMDFIQRCPDIAWGLRNDVLTLVDQAINGFRQSQLSQFLHLLVVRLPDPDSYRKETEELICRFSEKLYGILSDACIGETPALNVTHARDTLKAANQVLQWTNRNSKLKENVAQLWRPESWKDLPNKFASSVHFKASTSLVTLCKQIAKGSQSSDSSKAVLNGESTTTVSKRKIDDTDDTSKRKKRKKVKKSNSN